MISIGYKKIAWEYFKKIFIKHEYDTLIFFDQWGATNFQTIQIKIWEFFFKNLSLNEEFMKCGSLWIQQFTSVKFVVEWTKIFTFILDMCIL